MAAARQLARRALLGLLPDSRFMASGPRRSKQVALTFDDGPHPEHTPRLLDRLAELDLKASFFVVGREAERHPDIVARAAREGHAIGHHSWSHSEPSTTSTVVLMEEVARSIELLQSITGKRPDRFRPPKGQLTAGKLLSLLRGGQRIILWSADPRDYLLHDSGELAVWAGRHRPSGGDIVLLHDVHPHAANTLDFLASWRRRGLEFVTLDEWLPRPVESR